MERKHVLNEFTIVATLCASAVIATLNWINSLIPANTLTGFSAWTVQLLAGTGTYLLMFKVAMWIYYRVVWRLICAPGYIGGHWHYTYNQTYDIQTDTYDQTQDKLGKVRINHTAEDISFHAESSATPTQQGATSLISQWKSVAVSLWGEQVHVAITITSASGTEHGFAVLHIIGEPAYWHIFPVKPNRISGHYFIVSSKGQVPRVGRIEFERDA